MARTALVVIALVAGTVTAARAQNRFLVEPTRIDLSSAAPAGALSITNHGDAPLRVQLMAARWHDDIDGTPQIEPTKAILLRPSIVEIPAGKTRAIRIGTTIMSGPTEASFRVFIEELPDRQPTGGAQIRVLTRISVPVFIAPRSPSIKLSARATIAEGKVVVAVHNAGTKHVKLAKVQVGARRDGARRWVREATGWYVLAGSDRRFAIDLTGEGCAAADRLIVELTDEDGQVVTGAPAPCEK